MVQNSNLRSRAVRWLQQLVLVLSVTTMSACGGSNGSSGSSDIRNVITTAEFLLVDPPSLSELLAVLRLLTSVTSDLRNDPDRLARDLFDGIRDSIATSNPVSGVNLDELFELAVDQLSRDSWRLILSDPVRGIVAAEVFEQALREALTRYSCDEHASHIGAKTDAFFQVLWTLLILQTTGDDFADSFSREQANGRDGSIANMLRSNATFARTVSDRFSSATVDDLIQLLLTSPFRLDPLAGATTDSIVFISDALDLDGHYQGSVEQRIGSGDEPVRVHINRCGTQVRAQVQLLRTDGSVDAEWRLTGNVDAGGAITLNSVDRLERFFTSTQALLCRGLSLTLSSVNGQLSGQWNASSLTCPLGGDLLLSLQSP